MCRPTSINAGLMDFITANISNSSIKINISISYLDNVVDSYFSSIFDTLWDKICYTTFDIVKKPEKKNVLLVVLIIHANLLFKCSW